MTTPDLTVYVVHADDNGRGAVLRGLLAAYGQKFTHPVTALAATRHSFHLRADIHREHACACAVLVVSDTTGVDAGTRLAVLHARREGVHRFVLLIQQHDADNRRADARERDARGLLAALDVDGDVPVVRSRLATSLQSDMQDLVAALDELPCHLEPSPLAVTPPYAREAALLDAVRPLFAPATILDASHATPTGIGGTFSGGAPYREQGDPWPHCGSCHQPMGCLLQVDSRDAMQPAPSGLFVVLACSSRGCSDSQQIRHYAAPSATHRQDPPASPIPWLDQPLQLRPLGRAWQLPDSALLVEQHPDIAARLSAITGGGDPVATFHRVATAMGCCDRWLDHLGGHHDADDLYDLLGGPILTPRCPTCAARETLVVQLRVMGRLWYLWACREHPAVHHCTSQPLGIRM